MADDCFNAKCFKEFMQSQCKEIKKHRWIESEKAGIDLGAQAELDWIRNHAKSYRDWWESATNEDSRHIN